MELNSYLDDIDKIAQACIGNGQEAVAYVEQATGSVRATIDELVILRKKLLTEVEQDEVVGLLSSGFFKNYSNLDRVACFQVCFDIERREREIKSEICCAKYSPSNYLFEVMPDLLNYIWDDELVKLSVLEQITGSSVVKFGGRYAVLDDYLNPQIVSFSQATLTDVPIYVRLDPHKAYFDKPSGKLFEAAIRPANPKWLSELELKKGKVEGFKYALQPCKCSKETETEFKEYFQKRIRKLEGFARRYGDDRLSMMIEEISSISSDEGQLIGRCIHFDTFDAVGTNIKHSKLQHLDMAINFYFGEQAKKRINDDLSQGKVVDADCRKHIFRIEGMPFVSFMIYGNMFFESTVLLREWLSDQFMDKS